MKTTVSPTLTKKQIARFYEPLIIYETLSAACKSESTGTDENEREPSSVQLTEKERFHRFVYKLAYICASDKGPDTVTSFAVLQNDRTDEVVLVFGANRINDAKALKVSDYVRKILFVISQLETLGTRERAAIRKAVLKHIFIWNRGRVEAYLKGIANLVGRCVDHGATEHHDTQVCVEAIRIINKLDASDFKGLGGRARGHMTGSQDSKAWSELLHCISRLKAYDQAVDALIQANSEWPEVFQTDRLVIHHVSSSKRMTNPLGKKSMNVDNCIGRMTNDQSIMAQFRNFGANLQKFQLNERIESQCMNETFRPFVHAEVLVYDWITTRGEESGLSFFNGWKYIGASKPTCKLCDYFFDAVGGNIGRRSSHGNVYINWRLPDGYRAASSEGRSSVYITMNNRIRDDAFKILSHKGSTGKPHDSDTYSCWTTRQTEAGSTQAEDGGLGISLLGSMFARLLSFGIGGGSSAGGSRDNDNEGSVRGEASDRDEDE